MKKNTLKQKLIITAFVSLVLVSLLFTAFAFGSWQANPAKWTEPARVMFAVISLMTICVPSGYVIIDHED